MWRQGNMAAGNIPNWLSTAVHGVHFVADLMNRNLDSPNASIPATCVVVLHLWISPSASSCFPRRSKMNLWFLISRSCSAHPKSFVCVGWRSGVRPLNDDDDYLKSWCIATHSSFTSFFYIYYTPSNTKAENISYFTSSLSAWSFACFQVFLAFQDVPAM